MIASRYGAFLCVDYFLQGALLQEGADVTIQFCPEAPCGAVALALAVTTLAQTAHRGNFAFKVLKDFFYVNVSRGFGKRVSPA